MVQTDRCSRAYHEELGDLYYFCGSTANWKMQNYHYHSTCELILVQSDHITVNIENISYDANAGDLVLIRSGERHQIISQNLEEPYRRYVLMFREETMHKLADDLGFDFLRYFSESPDTFISRLSLSEKNQNEIIRMLNRIDPLYSKQSKESLARIYLIIVELLITVQRLYDFFKWSRNERAGLQSAGDVINKDHENEKERVREIKSYISANLDKKLTLNDIAEHFYMSKSYLSHYFRQETGFCIMQYVTLQKMISAKRMLLEGKPIRLIAMDLGYNSDSHFITTFLKYTGITPKQYLMALHSGKNQ